MKKLCLGEQWSSFCYICVTGKCLFYVLFYIVPYNLLWFATHKFFSSRYIWRAPDYFFFFSLPQFYLKPLLISPAREETQMSWFSSLTSKLCQPFHYENSYFEEFKMYYLKFSLGWKLLIKIFLNGFSCLLYFFSLWKICQATFRMLLMCLQEQFSKMLCFFSCLLQLLNLYFQSFSKIFCSSSFYFTVLKVVERH